MAENLTIARPYAKAVFAQAIDDKTLDEWEKLLKVLTETVENPLFAVLIDNPKIESSQLLELLIDVSQKSHPKFLSKHTHEVNNFLKLLIAEKRLNVLPEISEHYQTLVTKERHLEEVVVTSAFPLSSDRRKALTEALTHYLHSKLLIEFQEDISLIGGAIIRSGNWVMDNSIKGKLQHLQDALQE